MHQAPPPHSRDLLLPLLACLPASFASPRPPPALLPLLSPLLRSRINYLSTGTNGKDGWLPLLSWDQSRGAKLPAVVEQMDLEPHPVSGEVELDEIPPAAYRRLDAETLHSRFEVQQFDLLPEFVWCEVDEHGNADVGWKLAELRSLDDKDNDSEWYESQAEAIDASDDLISRSIRQTVDVKQEEDEDDNDDYWASYDRTPSQTPGQDLSSAPTQAAAYQTTHWAGSRSEMDYYDRYGAEVQPALDAHDPDEEMKDPAGSTLNGNAVFQQVTKPQSRTNHADSPAELSMPRPLTPASSHSSVDKLEARAAAMSRSSSEAEDRAQLGIKQHISTDIKSLFRLAKSVGMDRAEFERIVKTELEVLSLLEQDE